MWVASQAAPDAHLRALQAITILKAGAEAAAGAHDAEIAHQIKALSRKLRNQGRASTSASSGGNDIGGPPAGTGAGVISENGGKVRCHQDGSVCIEPRKHDALCSVLALSKCR